MVAPRFRGIVALALLALSVGQAVPTAPTAAADVRVAGDDRYATAAAISAGAFSPGVSVVHVATGVGYADALAAGPAAARAGGPILLVASDGVPAATAAELDRLDPGRIVVVGGPGTVSDAVVDAVAPYASNGVSRVAGADRYETAAALSAATFAPGVAVAYVAAGTGFADALAAGSAGARLGGPVLLVEPGTVPPSTLAELSRLAPQEIVVVGGAASVSDDVVTALGSLGRPVRRVAGADRYATAAALSAATAARGAVSTVYLATGASFPDALAVAPLGGRGPVLLSPGTCIALDVHAEQLRLGAPVTLVGGSGIVSDLATDAVCGAGVSGAPADPGQPVTWTGDAGARRLTLLGDSSLSGVRWTGAYQELLHHTTTFDAESCRRIAVPSCRGRERYVPLNGLDALRRHPDLGEAIVAMIGYNDWPSDFAAGVEAVMALANQRGVATVYWLTLRTTGVTYTSPEARSNGRVFAQNNAYLRDALTRHPTLRLIDWDTYAAGRTDWTASDGVHLTVTGAHELMRFIDQHVHA